MGSEPVFFHLYGVVQGCLCAPTAPKSHLLCPQDVRSAPAPSDAAVTLHAVPERWYAAWVFTGHPAEADIVGRMESVRMRTRAEGTKPVCCSPSC